MLSMHRRTLIFPLLLAGFLLSGRLPASFAQTAIPVLTRSYNNQRVGANSAETFLTADSAKPGYISSGTFGLLFSRPVDGEVYAQPLYIPNMNIAGGVHNVLFVATMHDSLYAFDADNPYASAPLWKTSYLQTIDGVHPVAVATSSVPTSDIGFACGTYKDIAIEAGILSTPVIDSGTGTMYVVARTKEPGGANGTYVQRLHVVDITTGLDKATPVPLAATYPKSGGTVTFDPLVQNQRCALLLDHGNIYIAWASHCDSGTYHGWVMAYNAATLQQVGVWCSTPDGSQGGIWQSGQGLSADAAGNIYLVVGNGTNTVKTGGTGYGNAMVKLSVGGATGLTVTDWFMPYNTDALNSSDLDSECGVTLIPGPSGKTYAIMGSKGGYAYICDTSNLGRYNPNNAGSPQNNNQIVGSFQVTNRHIHGSAAIYYGPSGTSMYLWGEYSSLKAFAFNGTTFNSTPSSQTPYNAPNGMPGGTMTVSSNGAVAGSGIVWANLPWTGDANQAVVPGVLRAFDATDMTKELWNSHQSAARDDFGSYAKYCPPLVTNGKVYMATFSNQVVAYGILPAPLPVSNLTAIPGAQAVGLNWTAAPYASSYNVKRSLSYGGTYTMIATGITGVSYVDTGLTNGVTYYYKVSGTNGKGTSADSNIVAATPAPQTGGSGNGLTGSYYTGDAADFSPETGTPFLTTIDTTVNFNYKNNGVANSPRAWNASVPTTHYTTVWTGLLLPPVSGNYTFYTNADDGVRLSLDSGSGLTPLISDAAYHAPTLDSSVAVPLLGGRKYSLKLEYFQGTGGATCQLFWAYPGQEQQIIPQAQLFATGTPSATVRGRIALDGVGDLTQIPAAVPVGPFTVEFRTPGTFTDIYTTSAALTPVGAGSPFGTFSVGGVPAGTYDIAVKGSKNLRVALPNIAVSGVTTLPDITLPGADANDDNSVDVTDFGLLVNAYGSLLSAPNSGYDARADFTFDGMVDVGDFGILINNYGALGAL